MVRGGLTRRVGCAKLACVPKRMQFRGERVQIKLCGLLDLTLVTMVSPPFVSGVTDISYVTTVPEPMSFGLAAAGIGLFCFARSWRSLQLILNLGFLVGVLVLVRTIAAITSTARDWSMPMTAAREAGAARKVDGRFSDP